MCKWKNSVEKCIVFIITILCVWMLTHEVYAHKVTVFAWIEGTKVHCQAKFAGGKQAVDSPINVYDADGGLILNGKTNDRGNFTFPLPDKTPFKVVIDAGMGHKGHWTVTSQDVEDAKNETSISYLKNHLDKAPQVNTPGNGSTDSLKITTEEIQLIIESALDKKLSPLSARIKSIEESSVNRFQDVAGGIGYIFGLVGIAAYVHSRKTRKVS